MFPGTLASNRSTCCRKAITTFTDPPFFFPYDRVSGCVRVKSHVRATSKHVNPNHPAVNLTDGDLSTFWISGSGDSQPGGGPKSERPDWIQIEFPRPVKTGTLVLQPRENYGPRDIELQVPGEGQHEFTTIARFRATNQSRQLLTFPETSSRQFRIVLVSSYDPRYPSEPRNAQIREIEFLEVGSEGEVITELAVPELHEATATHEGQGMRVSYRKPQSGGIVQYVTVISLPDEATIYSTIFRASRATTVRITPLFPLRTAAPPGFEKTVVQHRGDRWLNMSDHVGFVSLNSLPKAIPHDRFYLTEQQTFAVQQGEWFGRAAVVVYARQSHAQTARCSPTVRILDDSRPEQLKLTLDSSSGTSTMEIDFADMEQ